MSGKIKQILYTLSPSMKREYYAINVECPYCNHDNIYIYYNLNKPSNYKNKCPDNDMKQRRCPRHIQNISLIKDIHNHLTTNDYTDYNIKINDEGDVIDTIDNHTIYNLLTT